MKKTIGTVNLLMSNEEFVEQILTNRTKGDLLIPDWDEEKFRKLYDYFFNERGLDPATDGTSTSYF